MPLVSMAFAEVPGEPVTAAARAINITVQTSHGSFAAELYPDLAPETVRLFLARAAAKDGVAAYAGSQLCESRAHAFLVFGCTPFDNAGPKPVAARRGPAQPDEVDARAMGLDREPIDDPAVVNDLWQREIYPRYVRLSEAGRPVPDGLAALMSAVKARGMDATNDLRGKSRLWYLEAMGFRFTAGRSPLRLTRGALATYSLWPGEADERFLIAFDHLSERDGRATVFGRVTSGWDTLDAISRIPVDKWRRPDEPVFITSIDVSALTGKDQP